MTSDASTAGTVRAGPRCANRPDTDGDPLQELTDPVTTLVPALDDATALTALQRVTGRPASRHHLTWASSPAPTC